RRRRAGQAGRILGPGAGLRARAAAARLRDWEDFGRSIGMPEEKFGDQAAVIDPADEGPRLFFQRVPERKTSGAKNRVHLDVRVGDREVQGEARKQLMCAKVEQLVEAGASVAWVNENVGGHSIVL